jgi:heat shock protein HslJ
MLKRKFLITILLISLFTTFISADNITIKNLKNINGNWHLRAMDGHEVRKARAILDFDAKKMKLNGFDSCNRISGTLKTDNNNTFSSILMTTRMACRQSIHTYVSKRLHETISEGFTITESKRYGVNGITLKSKNHDLFFKKMGN